MTDRIAKYAELRKRVDAAVEDFKNEDGSVLLYLFGDYNRDMERARIDGDEKEYDKCYANALAIEKILMDRLKGVSA